MNFSLVSNSEFIPDELRTAFKELVRKEIDAREPAQGAKMLDSTDQIELSFKIPKKTLP